MILTIKIALLIIATPFLLALYGLAKGYFTSEAVEDGAENPYRIK